jgi:tetratricopeptide (TPR) repeat protein
MRPTIITAALALCFILHPSSFILAEPPAVEKLPDKPPAWLDGYRLRYPLRVIGDPAAYTTSKTVIARLPTGGWLRPDGSDVIVQTAAGKEVPVAVLSHDPAGETIIQFPRNGNDRWYWAYAVSARAPAKAEPAPEGVILELRDWAGDNLDSWPKVLEGLKKSDKIIGNAVVSEVIQNCNPARPDDPRKFAASYRGYLDIKKDGVYRFFVNSDDAAFLFIDGFKVCERTGSNTRLVGQVIRKLTGVDVQLKAGVHPLEVHHAVGNNPASVGYCTLIWMPPGQAGWTFVKRDAFVQPVFAEPAGLEHAGGTQAAAFVYGVDDTLSYSGSALYLVRFEAVGMIKDVRQLTWDFGDGTTGTGQSPMHVYFKNGSYAVTLRSADGLPAFHRTVHVWQAPAPTSPLSPAKAVRLLAAADWQKFDVPRLKQMFDFLLVCEQAERWPLLEKLAQRLLAEKDLDPKLRLQAHTALMEAMAEQGRGRDALKLVEPALKDFPRQPSLQVGIKLTAAEICRRHLKEPAEAGRLYQDIVETHRRLDHPNVRLAAIRWGDLLAESGDMAKAGETYRLAATLGERPKTTAQGEAITRGALLRIAEQRLRNGNIRETQQLLQRIEVDYPDQKLEGLYRFLRAEADRLGGRYEDAIRNYEFLLKLTQWAGYRDRALYGIADSYNRMGNYEKALAWLDTVKESFPRYFEKQRLPAYQAVIEGRLKRQQAARGSGAAGAALFTGFQTGFEPGEKQSFGELNNLSVQPGLGIAGPYVCRAEEVPIAKSNPLYKLPLANLTSEGTYWIEFWYHETALGSPIGHIVNPMVQAYLYGIGPDVNPDGGSAINISLERTHGNWRKFAVKLKAPVTQDGRLDVYFYYPLGIFEIDGLSVAPVSDRQNDSLQSFIEGTEKP